MRRIRKLPVLHHRRYSALPLPLFLAALIVILGDGIFWRKADALHRTSQRAESRKVKKFSQYLDYKANWSGTRTWIGPDWWANPLYDWSLRNGAVISVAKQKRTLCLLTAEVSPSLGSRFEMEVNIELLDRSGETRKYLKRQVAAGFRIGRQGEIGDFRNALISAKKIFDAKVNRQGNLILGPKIGTQKIDLFQGSFTLRLFGETFGRFVRLSLTATQRGKRVNLSVFVPKKALAGGISLLSDGPIREIKSTSPAQFAFRKFSLKGDLVRQFPTRSFGPILWSQYTLNQGTLRVSAQLAPLDKPQQVTMWVKATRSKWRKVSTSKTDSFGRIAIFTIFNWNSKTNKVYEIRTQWEGGNYAWSGVVRREPSPKKRLKIACFSCDNGYLFPLPQMVQQVQRQNPDMLFFAGDQIYEVTGGFQVMLRGPIRVTILDFLRKYYLFGWTWRVVLRDRPSVILPDDHDVFQGNLFGNGGIRLQDGNPPLWGEGGYLMPGPWVNAVERAQMGHLPNPAVNMTLPIGTKARFTSMTYGGVGFAILEDRKFKTGIDAVPRSLQKSGGGANLLGLPQEQFLRKWTNDWRGHSMKCALSQTMFAAPKTHYGWNLDRSKFYFDNGAWPRRARDRVVRMLAQGRAFSIHGDQHLGMLARIGVRNFNDGGYAFMVPGTANGWPRAWWPGLRPNMSPTKGRKFTGKYYDDAGIPLNVLAVANPDPQIANLRLALPRQETNAVELGYKRGSGYGVVEFDKVSKRVRVSLYRLPKEGRKNEMFEGFPRILFIGGKPN